MTQPICIIGVGNTFRGDDGVGILAARRLKETVSQQAEIIEAEASCQFVGIIGHIAIFYRQHLDPEKRKIKLPHR